MKKFVILGAIVACSLSSVQADDSLKASASSASKNAGKVKKEISSSGPTDRVLEFRAGPRASFLSGNARVGVTGTEVDVFGGLGDASAGAQVDLETRPFGTWQPGNIKWLDRVHIDLGFTYDNYDHTGNTTKAIATDRGDMIQSGSSLKAKLDVYTYEVKLGYDLIKNNTWRVKPYIGGKWAVADGSASVSGTVVTATPNSTTATGTRTAAYKDSKATVIGGVDTRAYVSRDWYLGADVAGFGYNEWSYVTGDAYSGYDITKNFGVRAGYSFDYADYKNRNNSVKIEPLLGAAYVQFVMGF